MRIAIDGRELCGRPTGVGRYLAHLLKAWDTLPEASAHQFVLYLPAGGEAGDDTRDPLPAWLSHSALHVEVRRVPGGSGTWWEQARLPAALRRDRPDVLFSPAYTAPVFAGVPVVVTLHDLSFVAHPEWFPLRTRLRRRVITRLSARRACRVLTDAEFSRQEVIERLGVAADKVRVIPLGLAAVAQAGLGVRPSAGEGRPVPAGGAGLRPCSRPVVLFVGSIFNRRHLPDLVRAFALVVPGHPGLRLEIVGDNRTHPAQDLDAIARENGVGACTTIRSYVPDETLADLYAKAGVFVFLSDYEGFGLTPLEALAAGVPILVGDTAVAREVYGDAAVFVATTDVARIAAELERLLCDRDARAAVLARAPVVLARYSWERAGRDTLATLVEAGRG